MSAVAELVTKASALSDAEKSELIVNIVSDMKALALKSLVEKVESTFGVKASGGGGGFAAPAAAAEAAPAKKSAEPTEFDVILVTAGDQKIKVIKEVRAVTNLGLKEAKDLVDGAPKAIKEKIRKEDAEKLKAQFEEAGAKVEIKAVG